ncbi:hypothetical protein [Microbacterium sp. zg-YB36]|uniref:hypothetical protein n=1 Tax=Microbacterium sp. zg-YB36 TaxID=2969407 RepID=UPI00214B4D57|nr:hypothetical protein [Microbacterium sp. zg-YB36]MDL5351163.1 hypothetical protein [Microbacterium sp. zg-YB36]
MSPETLDRDTLAARTLDAWLKAGIQDTADALAARSQRENRTPAYLLTRAACRALALLAGCAAALSSTYALGIIAAFFGG